MAGILDLPVETLIEIFCLLEDFDDVFHLSRSCRRLYIPIETEMDYKKIMKSIILRSPVYTRDLQLCQLSEISAELKTVYTNTQTFPPNHRAHGDVLRNIHFGPLGPITDERLESIVCRWQGLKLIEDLYCDSVMKKLSSEFEISHYDVSRDLFEHPNTELLAATAERIRKLSCQSPQERSHAFNSEERQRFYKAVITYWYALELHWLTERSHHTQWKAEWELADAARLEFSGDSRQDVLAVEMLEIHGFLYKFLLRVVFPDAASTRLWLQDDQVVYLNALGLFDHNNTWDYFVRSCKLFLNPIDVIELLSSTCLPHPIPWPPDKPKYLQERGAFDPTEATSSTPNPNGESLGWWIDEHELAYRVGCGNPLDKSFVLPRNCDDLIHKFPAIWGEHARASNRLWTWFSGTTLEKMLLLKNFEGKGVIHAHEA